MRISLVESLREVIGRHRGALIRERDEIAQRLSEAERKRPVLESQSEENPDDRRVLNELGAIIGGIERDRWRREWMDQQLSLLDRIEEELHSAVSRVEVDQLSAQLDEYRNRLQAVKEEIPPVEERLNALRGEVPRLEATMVSLTERLGELRRKSGPGG